MGRQFWASHSPGTVFYGWHGRSRWPTTSPLMSFGIRCRLPDPPGRDGIPPGLINSAFRSPLPSPDLCAAGLHREPTNTKEWLRRGLVAAGRSQSPLLTTARGRERLARMIPNSARFIAVVLQIHNQRDQCIYPPLTLHNNLKCGR